MIIPFGEYAPDRPDFGNQGTIIAKNVIPHETGYQSFSSLSVYSSALDAYCRGSFTTTDPDGNIVAYSGNQSKLYRLVGTTQTDSSKSGGYNCATDSVWQFIKWGDKCIATNFDDAIQVITLGGTQFADLSGSPPKARHISVVRDFVVVGNTNDPTDGNVPHRIRWSGINDETSWTVSATTQADYQDLEGSGGWVQAIIGNQERGVIFQERAIWLMSYVGSPVVFQFDQVEDARGAYCPRGVISVGNIIYYIADDGFYAYHAGQSIPIGNNKVDETFIDDLDDSYLHRVTVAAVPNHKIIIWSYPSSNSVDGTPDKCLLYNWSIGKWAFAEFNHELIFRAQSLGLTLDGMDASYPQLDQIPFSLDSKIFMGGALELAAFDTDHKLAYFTGTSQDATFETGEFQLFKGQRAEINELTPLVDGGTHSVQIGTRETQAGTFSWSSEINEESSGKCSVRSNSRYHRIRVKNTGDFVNAIGVEVNNAIPVGDR